MTYDEAKKAFVKTVNEMSGKYPAVTIFSDFVEMAACSLHNAFRKRDDLEKRYLDTAKKYSAEELNRLSSLLAYVVEGLEDRFGDFLGEAYEKLEISNSNLGQFFTPYSVAKLTAAVAIDEKEVKQAINEKGYVRINEPACGGGSMIVAALDVLESKGVNFQKECVVIACDKDQTCAYMTYITLSLLGVPAIVINGDSLLLETYQTLYTPFYVLRHNLFFKSKEDEKKAVKNTFKENEEGQMELF